MIWEVFLLIVLCAIIFAQLYQPRDENGRKYVFPKGPPGLPFVGNQFQLPHFGVGPLLKQWADQYGEMMRIRLAGTDLIYLNSSRVVHEILQKRSALTSSRPHQPMAGDLISGGSRILMMPYNARWRTSRKLAHQVLMSGNVLNYQPIMEKETLQLLYEYLTEPQKWYISNNRLAHSLLMNMVFGQSRPKPDKLMDEIFKVSEEFILELQPGKNLVDSYPSLTYLPKCMQWWRRKGEELYRKTCETFQPIQERMLLRMKEERGKGTAESTGEGGTRNCFSRMMLESQEELGLDDHQAMFIGGSLVETGSDTLRASLNALLVAIVCQPHWTRRARHDLDTLCGSISDPSNTPTLRLPTFSDMSSLPYLVAAVKESLRWKPLVEAGVNHMSTEPIAFEGYYFPKGTLFTWNAWAIAQDPAEYKDPEQFKPERWLEKGDGRGQLGDITSGLWAFGAGRRTCPGHSVAARTLFILLARLLYCFDFEVDGELDRRVNVFLGAKEEAFKLRIKIRSQEHRELIEREWGKIEGTWMDGETESGTL